MEHTGENAKGQRSNDIFQFETQVCENSRIHENIAQNSTHVNYDCIDYMDKMNMLTRDQYILPKTAQFGEIFNTRIVSKSSTLASLVRKFNVIIHALITLGLTAKKKMKEGAHLMTKEFL